MQLPDISSLSGFIESLMGYAKIALVTVSSFIKDQLHNVAPQYETLAILGIAFGIGYFTREKLNIPAWVMLGILIFAIIKFI